MTAEQSAERLQQIHRFSDECRADIVFAIKAAIVSEREAPGSVAPPSEAK